MIKEEKFQTVVATVMMVIILVAVLFFTDDKDLQKNVVEQITNTVTDMATREMSEEEVKELPTTEIIEQTLEDEEKVSKEQEIEDEGFQLQGEIAYEGDRARSWNVELGDYKGLTYYSQIDSRWANRMYSSVGDRSQTIGTSGCGPTSASVIVTACKGAITPDQMADLFVKYGYRSSNNGTYWSAFRAVADEFDIGYTETSSIQKALQLLQNNNYVVVSVGNGLFTTGGHFIVLTNLDGNIIEVYDPYLYAGKFDTSTRRGKATVNGNVVYLTVDNFINYANAKQFFCYEHDEITQVNNTQPIVTQNYTRYINAKIGLNVRNTANGRVVGALVNSTRVTVAETQGDWSRIVDPVQGWVSSNYLAANVVTNNIVTQNPKIIGYKTGRYKVTKVSNKSVLNVRYGAGINYKNKNYAHLSANARLQNKQNGNYYANGYKNGVVCTVTQIKGNWGKTASGWICLDYCSRI